MARIFPNSICSVCGKEIELIQYAVGMDIFCSACYFKRYPLHPAVPQSPVIPVQPGAVNLQERVHQLERENAALKSERDDAQGEIGSLLEYARTGHCAEEDCGDVAVHSKDGLELFDKLRGLVGDSMVGHSLNGEVTRLEARDARFVKHLDAIATWIRGLVNEFGGVAGKPPVSGFNNKLVELMHETGGDVELFAMMQPGQDWYHMTPDDVLKKLAYAEISEGGAAYLLGVDRIQVRVVMEDKYGVNWRDMADDAEAAKDGES